MSLASSADRHIPREAGIGKITSRRSHHARVFAVLAIALAWFTGARALHAQIPPLDATSAGTHYVLAFPDTVASTISGPNPNLLPDVFSILVYSAVDNQVTVNGQSFHKSVALKGGTFTTVTLHNDAVVTEHILVDATGLVSNNTYQLDATSPVVIYCYMMTNFGGEMWTPLPVASWGKDYLVSAEPGEVLQDEFRKKKAGAEAVIVAGYDNTTVTIYPTASIIAAPLTVTLNANQSYEIRSAVDTTTSDGEPPVQPDIGGTRIIANRPIGVLSGNTRAQVDPNVTALSGRALKNMGMEWLAPIEQYGTEFVYMPTWDLRHLLGTPNEKVEEKRQYEYVRLYGTSQGRTPVYFIRDSSHTDTSSVSLSRIDDLKIQAIKPHMIRSDKPAQVTMHSAAVARGTSSETWGAYMVELVPRQQWTTFAPYFAPRFPYETQHFINVVADTNALDMIYDENGAPFDFNMGRIPGTSMMWGSYRVTSDAMHYLEGREGTKFFAYMYGLRQGYDYGYSFQLGLSYGVPLAPERRILRGGDTLQIDTVANTCSMQIHIHAVNDNPVGLRSVVLAPNSANVRLTIVQPGDAAGVIGFSAADLDVAPIDSHVDASGVVVITDRTGKVWQVRYSYVADRVQFNADQVFNLGEVNLNETKDTVVTITNPLNKAICIKDLRLARGVEALTIVSTNPIVPSPNPPGTVTLPPGGTIRVTIQGAPTIKGRVYRDTLRAVMCCTELALPLRLGAAAPCIEVGDLDFGTLALGQEKALDLRICNHGAGTLTLNNPAGDSVVTWLASNFTIDKTALDSLRNVTLGAGACTSVKVRFHSAVADTFVAVARVWATTRDCRDTSVWRAVVAGPKSSVPGESVTRTSIQHIYPDPSNGGVAITFSLATAGSARLEIYNAIGERVATLFDARTEAGGRTILWNASAQPSGMYYCRLITGDAVFTKAVHIAR